MQQMRKPVTRIRCVRGSDPRALTPENHRTEFLIAYAEPAYPPDARAGGIEGTVLLDAVIGRDGAVQELSVREGHPSLAETALETIRHWSYRPTKLNGIPVEVKTEIEVKFTLPDSVVSS